MRKIIKVRCAECGTIYHHTYNAEYCCPTCGNRSVYFIPQKKRLGKTGVDR